MKYFLRKIILPSKAKKVSSEKISIFSTILQISLMSGLKEQLDIHICFCLQSTAILHVMQPLENSTVDP